MATLFKYFGRSLNADSPLYGPPTGLEGTRRRHDSYDVVVVGGGVTGLSSALELAQAGQRVLLLEAARIGLGPSGRSGGQLWPGFEGSLTEMQQHFDAPTAKAAWELVHAGLRRVHQRLARVPHRCSFQPGVLLAAMDRKDNIWCADEAREFARSGLGFARYVDARTIRERLYSTTMFTGGLLYEGEDPAAQYGHINPLSYVRILAGLNRQEGTDILEHAPLEKITRRADGRYALAVGGQEEDVVTGKVVLATGAGFLRPEGLGYDLLPRQFIRAQTVMLATEAMPAALVREMIPGTACFSDTRTNGMNYGRAIPADDGSGRMHITFGGADALMQTQTALAAGRIERDLYRAFPLLREKGIGISAIWGGYCDLSPDSLPRVGEVQPGLFHLSGLSGQGLVLGAVLGQAVAEKVVMGTSPRFNLLAALSAKTAPFPRHEGVAKALYASRLLKARLAEKLAAISR